MFEKHWIWSKLDTNLGETLDLKLIRHYAYSIVPTVVAHDWEEEEQKGEKEEEEI